MTNPCRIPKMLTLCAFPSGAPRFAGALRLRCIKFCRPRLQVVDEAAGVKFLPEVEFMSGRPRLQGLMMDHHRLAVTGHRTAENRTWEVLHGFKDGDTM